MTNEIKALEQKVFELEKQLFETRSLLHKTQCDALGIHAGDLVKDRRGREFKVSRIEIWGGFAQPKACLNGNRRTKDGWSKVDQYIGIEWSKL